MDPDKKYTAAAVANMRRLDPLVRRMYADYQTGLTLAEVAAKHGRGEKYGQQNLWPLFKVRGLQLRKGPGPAAYVKIAATRRARLDALVDRMYADYQAGMSLNAVAKKYGRDRRSVAGVFKTRSLPIRVVCKEPARHPNGQVIRLNHSADEITAIIKTLTRFHVPAELRVEWRRWSLAKRAEIIAQMRQILNKPDPRPSGPYSANVTPFAYGTPAAHAIARRMNIGRNSRTKAVAIKPASVGVIWNDRLYFWAEERSTGAYYIGPFRPDTGRPSLHHTMWEQHHGRKLPAGHVIRFIDGNFNNLTIENFQLASRNDLARENQAAGLNRKSREATAILLNRTQGKDNQHGLKLTRLRRR